jgi:hypothetical protein
MITEIVSCLDHALNFVQEQVADLSDDEIALQPAGAPNHAAWTLGHLVYSCQSMAVECGMQPWLPSDWESQFGYGSSPQSVKSELLSRPKLLAALTEAGNRLRTALRAIDEDALAKPLPDEQAREVLPTVAHALLQVVVAHTSFHAGQLAAWRRAIGRTPVGVFV